VFLCIVIAIVHSDHRFEFYGAVRQDVWAAVPGTGMSFLLPFQRAASN